MPIKSTGIPVLLFPLKIETRFVGEELWLRVFPDEAFLQSHDPNLTQEELSDRQVYHAAGNKKEAWENLVGKYGAYRAAYLVHVQQNWIDSSNEVATTEAESIFYYKGLPEKFSLYLSFESKDSQGNSIIKTVSVDEQNINSNKNAEELVVFGPGDEWVNDFEAAVNTGMAFKINLKNDPDIPADVIEFKRIIVNGFYYRKDSDNNEEDTARGLVELFENHLYTEGISFLEHNTPTNNFKNDKSGYSIKDEFETEENFKTLVEDKVLSPTAKGKNLATALGVEEGIFKRFKRAEQETSSFHFLLQKLTWMALGGNTLQMTLGDQISEEDLIRVWQHYYTNVKARGSLAPIKIDDQPYGILPVTTIRQYKNKVLSPGAYRDQVLRQATNQEVEVDAITANLSLISSLLYDKWHETLNRPNGFKVPRLDDPEAEPYEELMDMLCMQPSSAFHELVPLEYSKLRGEVLHQLLQQAGGADQLERMTIGQAYQLLGQYNEDYQRRYAEIQEKTASLKEAFDRFKLDADQVDHSPIFSFKKSDDPISIQDDQLFHIQEQDLHFLEEVFQQVEQDASNSSENHRATEWINYRGESSFFSDLLLRSYANTVALFSPGQDKRTQIMTEFAQDALQLIQELKDTEHVQRQALLQSALSEIIDLNSYRLDAWISSIATARLATVREYLPTGLYFGAYGFVENLKKDELAKVNPIEKIDHNRVDDGGIIHCPTPAQALTATLFKNSYLTHFDLESQNINPFTLNLTSDRIQESERFMQGIRQGQEIEALLGYKMERFLHEEGLNTEIYKLRRAFPLEVNIVNRSDSNLDIGFKTMSVINGLAVIEANQSEEGRQLLRATLGDDDKVDHIMTMLIPKLENILDGSLDHLFFEAGFQLVQGNLSQSAAAMDAAKGDLEPPITDALKTKIPGVGISHKLVFLFPEAEDIDLSNNEFNCKGYIEPTLECWLKHQIGPLDQIGCKVQLLESSVEIDKVDVNLKDLGIGYLDLFYLSSEEVSDGASELELRIVRNINYDQDKISYKITDTPADGCHSLAEALEVMRYAQNLLSKSRFAESEDLKTIEESASFDWTALEKIKSRILNLVANLNRWKIDPDRKENKRALAKLNITESKRAFLDDSSVEQDAFYKEVNLLVLAVDEKLKQYKDSIDVKESAKDYKASFERLKEAAQLLFGKAFILLPPCAVSEKVEQTISAPKQELLIGNASLNDGNIWGQERIHTWLQELAQVNEGSSTFEEWLMISRVWEERLSSQRERSFQIAQYPSFDTYPWVALSKAEIDTLIASSIYKQVEVYKEAGEEMAYPIKIENGQIREERYYPDGCESLVIYKDHDAQLDSSKPAYGIVIDEFTEHIPDEKLDTGLSFHYNAPNNEAPQALLLAVAPPFAVNDWSEDLLYEIINDTIDLMKIRMVDPEAIEGFLTEAGGDKTLEALLPLTNWFNIPTIN